MNFQKILETAAKLEYLIKNLKISELALSNTGISYLHYNSLRFSFTSFSNATVLYKIIEKSRKPIDEMVIVDHGGGIGFFSFLCKMVGVGTVVYHDINKELASDALILSGGLSLPIEHMVIGNTKDLVEYCNTKNIMVNALGSRNVIEHIPDYNLFFIELSHLKSKQIVMQITTSANIHNPIIRYQHRKLHKRYDTLGPYSDMSQSQVLSQYSGNNLRKEILIASGISTPDLDSLVLLSREMDANQIEEAAKEFIQNGVWPSKPMDRSNTRDPIYGAWVERLVPYLKYKKAANNAGFKIEYFIGEYDENYSDGIKKFLAKSLNIVLKLTPIFKKQLSAYLSFRVWRD